MQNKSIFVTGGNSGIGLATALVFARAGADIAIFARRPEHNEKARALIEAEGRRCLTPTAGQALYAAAKAAVIGMTKVAALECAKDGVRVNVICPGATTGEMFHRFAEANAERAAIAVSKHLLGRIGDKEEVASAVVFLCRDATFTTGHAFVVDGGRLLN